MYQEPNLMKACSTTGMILLSSTRQETQLATLLWTGRVCTPHTSLILRLSQILALAPMRASFQRHLKDTMIHTGLALNILGFMSSKMCLQLALALLVQLSNPESISTLFPSVHPTALIMVQSSSIGPPAINLTAFPIMYLLMSSIPANKKHVLTQCGSLWLAQLLVYPTLSVLLDPTDLLAGTARERSIQTLSHLRQSKKRQGRNSMQFLIRITWIRLWECSQS